VSRTTDGEKPARLLRREGLRPRQRLGQNFLQDTSYLARILEAVEANSSDCVLELGAGTGVLTRALATHCGQVVAVELDERLIKILRDELTDLPNVTVTHANALDVDPSAIFAGPYKVAGNIPYYLTGILLRRYLEMDHRAGLIVLMVQKEVAQRMAAEPGKMSLLGISVQFYARIEVLAHVPAGAFFPRPKVDSAIVRLRPHLRKEDPETVQAFFGVAKAGFGSRRKQLANALQAGLNLDSTVVRTLLSDARIVGTRRAETLSISEWRALAETFREFRAHGAK
jgi:16S rRNA (adenine1518-N6/adenine1519-N6)-dimethyltransferase